MHQLQYESPPDPADPSQARALTRVRILIAGAWLSLGLAAFFLVLTGHSAGKVTGDGNLWMAAVASVFLVMSVLRSVMGVIALSRLRKQGCPASQMNWLLFANVMGIVVPSLCVAVALIVLAAP